jgi:hypothetical membrane protein
MTGAFRLRDRSGTGSEPRRLAGVIFFVTGALFLTGIMVAASIAPDYDYHGGAISDLGVIDATAVLFNVLLVGVGLLNIAGGSFFFRVHRRPWLFATYVLGGIGAIGAGLMPLDTGAPHALFALAGFVFFNIEALATASVLAGPMRLISAAAGVLGLVYVGIMIVGDGGNAAIFGAIGHGGTERMIVYPAMLWLLALGGHLMVRPRDA